MVTPDQIREFIRTGAGSLSNLSYDETSAACNKYFAHLPVPVAHCDYCCIFYFDCSDKGTNRRKFKTACKNILVVPFISDITVSM